MTVLGAVLAGGRSSRFGSDKAMALLHGRSLLDHAAAALARECPAVVVVGREVDGYACVADRPGPGLGPLGGLAAALHHAGQRGFDAVLTCGVDSIDLPEGLIAALSPPPAHLASQPVVGLWPVSCADALDDLLARDASHAVRAFAGAIGARAVESSINPANVNTPDDLERLEQHHGL